MTKVPPRKRKTALKSLREIAKRMGMRVSVLKDGKIVQYRKPKL